MAASIVDRVLDILEIGTIFTIGKTNLKNFVKIARNRYLDNNFKEFNSARSMLAELTFERNGKRVCGKTDISYLKVIISGKYKGNNGNNLKSLISTPASSA